MFYFDFLVTLKFAPMSFADPSDFIKRADNTNRIIQSLSFSQKADDVLSNVTFRCLCVKATLLSATERYEPSCLV